MREQDVDRNLGAGIELDGGIMAPEMGDLGDSAYLAARQIGSNTDGISWPSVKTVNVSVQSWNSLT